MTSRTKTPPHLRAQVLEMRRAQSAKTVAQALGIALGTVKAISSRSGITRDNQKLREFFKLPDPVVTTCTALQPPVAMPTTPGHDAGFFVAGAGAVVAKSGQAVDSPRRCQQQSQQQSTRMPRLLSGIQGQGIQRGIQGIGHCRMVTKVQVDKLVDGYGLAVSYPTGLWGADSPPHRQTLQNFCRATA